MLLKEPNQVELRYLVTLVRRNWLTIAIFITVGVAIGVILALVQTPVFTSTAKAFVSTQSASSVSDLSQGSDYTQQIVSSYADVATTPYVLEPVIKRLGLNDTPMSLAQRVEASAPAAKVLLEVSVSDTSAKRAASIANAITAELASRVSDLSPRTTNGSGNVKITQIQPAEVPLQQTSPRLWVNVLVGLVAGLLAGLATAALRRRLDTRLREPSDVDVVTDRPLLGSIRFDPNASAHPLVVQDTAGGPRAEAFRSLRTNLQFLEFGDKQDGRGRAFVVTSSIESEGKSTTSANLAIAIAEAGHKVLLVEADLRRPSLSTYLGLENSIGLTDVLIDKSSFAEARQLWGDSGLVVLPAGQIPPNPNELLQSTRMSEMIERLRFSFDTIIFDAPPLLPVSDAAILARNTDGALMVAASGRVRKAQLLHSVTALEQVDARILGVVLTMVPNSRRAGYDYGYGYGYEPSTSGTMRLHSAARLTR